MVLIYYFNVLEVTKKVTPGKINHKNEIKYFQIILFRSKTAEFQYCILLICQTFRDKTMNEKCQFSELDASYLSLKDLWNSLVICALRLIICSKVDTSSADKPASRAKYYVYKESKAKGVVFKDNFWRRYIWSTLEVSLMKPTWKFENKKCCIHY